MDYGQKPAEAEITAAKKICEHLDINHQIIRVDCSNIGSGDLSQNAPIEIAPKTDWWPFRNQMLATFVGAKALDYRATELMFGTIQQDGYHQDGTTDFFQHLSKLMSYQEGHIKVTAPAIGMSTEELINTSSIRLSHLMWAHSCHKSNIPCHDCRGCNKYLSTIHSLQDDSLEC